MTFPFWNPRACWICAVFVRHTRRKAGVSELSPQANRIDAQLLEAACQTHGVVALWRAWLRK